MRTQTSIKASLNARPTNMAKGGDIKNKVVHSQTGTSGNYRIVSDGDSTESKGGNSAHESVGQLYAQADGETSCL